MERLFSKLISLWKNTFLLHKTYLFPMEKETGGREQRLPKGLLQLFQILNLI